MRDDKGRKMSKSLGNVVDPLDVIAEYSCDALRFTLATGGAALRLRLPALSQRLRSALSRCTRPATMPAMPAHH